MNYGIWIENGSTNGNKIGGGFETSPGTDYYLKSNAKYNDGKSHYAVLTYDGSVLRLYIDGVQVASKSTTAIPDTTGTQPLRIGANSLVADRYFTGEIAGVNVISTILTASEVNSQYLSATSGSGGYIIPTIAGVKPTKVTYGSTVNTVCSSGCTHTTIKAAIDGLPAAGGKVVLKAPKTFTLSTTTYLRSNLVLEFQTGATISYTGAGPAIYGRNINNVMLINPVITTSYPAHVLYFEIVDTIIIQGGKITGEKGSVSAGFKCNNCKNVVVQNGSYSNFSRPIDVGTIKPASCDTQICKLTGDTRNVWLVSNTISNSAIECVHFNYGYDMHAIGNTIQNCVGNGLDIGFNSGVEAKNNKITNAGWGTDDRGVGLHTDSSTTVVVTGNTISHSGTNGIGVCGSDKNYIIANTITYSGDVVTNTLFPGYGTGINVIDCTGGTFKAENTIIDQNTVTNSNDGYGVYVSNTSKPSQITNNVLLNNEKGAYRDDSNSAVISGNTVS
ncbi:MAG: parallel beta-helix repeat protein [Candidatus Nitrosomirales archaeon]|jgi:parallel beta-helix repeat protein